MGRIPCDAKLAQRCDSAEYHIIEMCMVCQRLLDCWGIIPWSGEHHQVYNRILRSRLRWMLHRVRYNGGGWRWL